MRSNLRFGLVDADDPDHAITSIAAETNPGAEPDLASIARWRRNDGRRGPRFQLGPPRQAVSPWFGAEARAMPETMLLRRLLLPELKFRRSWRKPGTVTLGVEVEKESAFEVCPRCATASSSVYDHRVVKVRDEPLRDLAVRLIVRKRRFACRPCRRPFTEPVPGIRKGYRSTERYQRGLLWACENFSDLKSVRRAYRCSSGYLYKALYAQLEHRRRGRLYPWPAVIGLDEHFFRRGKGGFREFVSMVVDYKNRRLMELAEGRTVAQLEAQLSYIPGRENVRFVVLDMCDPFRKFAQRFFPNARLVADKFHVLLGASGTTDSDS